MTIYNGHINKTYGVIMNDSGSEHSVSIAEGKKNLSRILRAAESANCDVILTRRGKPVAVLVPFAAYQGSRKADGLRQIMEALALLESYVRGEIRMVVPSLLGFEVLNGLLIASRRGRFGDRDGPAGLSGIPGPGARGRRHGGGWARDSEDCGSNGFDGLRCRLYRAGKAREGRSAH